jgi:hypothetical protein
VTDLPEKAPEDWNLGDWNVGDWEKALTIHVGTAYICRICNNLVMITRGGVGVMELVCCGRPMEKLEASEAPSGGRGR